jgi:hypothetical protein
VLQVPQPYAGTLIQGKQSTLNYKLKDIIDLPETEWRRAENAHEAIIKKADFDLVQRLSRLDTRTAPDGMLSEKDLVRVVMESVKRKINAVISLDDVLKRIDAESTGQRIADRLSAQFTENEQRLEQIRKFKAGLYENMVSGVISKDEFKTLKAKYTTDADALDAANAKLEQEIEDVLSCKTERLGCLEHCVIQVPDARILRPGFVNEDKIREAPENEERRDDNGKRDLQLP